MSGRITIGADLRVRRPGFGAMRLTGSGVWGPPDDRGEAIRVLQRAVDLGVNFIDTADSYGPFVSEELIAEALHPYPEHLVIATKAGLERSGPGEWRPNGHPDHLRERCEGSLRRLRLERIDLFQLHRIDPDIPLEDQLGTLEELQREGKIHRVGLSEVTVEQLARAMELHPVVSVQNRYNLLDRRADPVLAACEERGLVFIPWAPLEAGPQRVSEALPGRILRETGATPAQVAIAWLLHRSPVILPIPGTGSIDHLEENMAAAGVELDEGVMEYLTSTLPRRELLDLRRLARRVMRKGKAVARRLLPGL